MLRDFPVVTDVYCGHSHFPTWVRVGAINGVSIGSGYQEKFIEALDV